MTDFYMTRLAWIILLVPVLSKESLEERHRRQGDVMMEAEAKGMLLVEEALSQKCGVSRIWKGKEWIHVQSLQKEANPAVNLNLV